MRADVVALGAVCPLGFDALQVSRCLRAGLAPVRSTRFVDAFEDALGAVFVPHLGEDVIGEERLARMAAPALQSALPAPPPGAPPGAARPVPVVLGVDPAFASDRGLFEAIAECGRAPEAPDLPIDWAGSRLVSAGHASFGVALEAALTLLGDGAPEVVVGAVDSHCDPYRLRKLDEAFAIHSRRAPQGFVPAEGAFFARLSRPGAGASGRGAARPLARIVEARSGLEATVPAGEVNLAAAATALVRGLEERCTEPVRWWLTDANGEPHRAREVSFVHTRSAPILDASTEHLPLGRMLGDLGAASMGLGLIHAVRLLFDAEDTAGTALLSGHGEGGERSVVLLAAPLR